ncbi:MAG: FAD-dependent oxidoreductase, partial [Blastopirellula sp.]|nr:FAD-dependent oxidoreductase [Blastopirellula sp.]
MSGVVTPAATLSIGEAANRAWDIGIVGAGVAGASLAIRLARRGLSVLLVEAQRFPREKVCGGCLNQRALDLLRELGLLDQCTLAGAVPLQWLRIRQ